MMNSPPCKGGVAAPSSRWKGADGVVILETSRNDHPGASRHPSFSRRGVYMTATFINGTKIADDIKREAALEVESLIARGIRPGLAVILVGDDAASSAYVNMKAKTCEQLGIYSRKLT